MRNPVAKNLFEFNKPKVERDRKKNPSRKQQAEALKEEKEHVRAEPYKRTKVDYLKDLLGDWDAN